MASRSLDDLSPFVRLRAKILIDRCKMDSIDLLVTCTLRDNLEQAMLYAQGRTKPGKIVTNAQPGQSAHNYGEALDVVPLRNGKPVWDSKDPVWQTVGKIGKECGLEWAGDWVRFKEYPHFQNPNWRPPK